MGEGIHEIWEDALWDANISRRVTQWASGGQESRELIETCRFDDLEISRSLGTYPSPVCEVHCALMRERDKSGLSQRW